MRYYDVLTGINATGKIESLHAVCGPIYRQHQRECAN